MKLPIHNPQDALEIGRYIAMSGMFRPSVQTDEAGAVIALMCHGEGMGLLQFQRTFHVVDGKPTMKADVMLAKLLELGGDFEIVERSSKMAAIKVCRHGKPMTEFVITMEDVMNAGYCFGRDGKTLKDNYRIRPEHMLWARVVSTACGVVDPRVRAGLYTPEEMEDAGDEDGIEREPSTPKPIDMNDAAKRAEAMIAENFPVEKTELIPPPPTPDTEAPTTPKPTPVEDPFASLPDDPVNYSLVPFGKYAGKRWGEMPREVLEKVLADPKSLTKQHIEAVKAAIENTPF